eukprot:scaffold32377_cov34-Tisochrysis_lutea.AAC.4
MALAPSMRAHELWLSLVGTRTRHYKPEARGSGVARAAGRHEHEARLPMLHPYELSIILVVDRGRREHVVGLAECKGLRKRTLSSARREPLAA